MSQKKLGRYYGCATTDQSSYYPLEDTAVVMCMSPILSARHLFLSNASMIKSWLNRRPPS